MSSPTNASLPASSPPPPSKASPPASSPPPPATNAPPPASSPPPPPPTNASPPASSPPPPPTNASAPASSPPPPSNAPPPASSPPPPSNAPPPASSPPPPPSNAPLPASSRPPPSSNAPPPASSPPPPPSNAPLPASSRPPPSSNAPPPASSPPPPPSNAPPPASLSPPPPNASPSAPASPTLVAPPAHSPPPPTNASPFAASPPPPSYTYSPPPPPNTIYSSPLLPFGTSDHPPPPPPPPSSSNSSVSTALVVGISIGGVIVLGFLCLLFFYCCCKKKQRRRDHNRIVDFNGPPRPLPKDRPFDGQPQHWQHNAPPPGDHIVTMSTMPSASPAYTTVINSSARSESNYSRSENLLPPQSPGIALGFSTSAFTYEDLEMATDGFSDANMLGQGGFGYVHRGVLPNGKEVAIKSLKASSGQGDREFQAEVEIISRVHHKYLVSLVGYCMDGSQRMLVYEFVPNKTLEFHLHGKGRPVLDWHTRLKIAVGTAKGLAYLHEDCHPKIIHRDIKAANILLDFNFEAKVADFGLARLSSDANTHISTRVMGTFGYLAPEYAASGKLTDKSDVFSFGVMLLELITGHRPVGSARKFNDDSLVDWARPLLTQALEDGNYDTLVDPRLQMDFNPTEMACMVACAASCVHHSARRRQCMSQIVRALEGNMPHSNLNEGIRPGNIYGGSHGSSDYDTIQYNEDMNRFRNMVFVSQEYGSSEHGLYSSGSSNESQQTTRGMEVAMIKRNRR
ncbi:hypothetical protein NE237_028647 [Protea cynaroides]|uniref:non-specific serine/threonine protein kinase n=1 Tax=Protea cynaroides TaxID=273540 RepID=A0A9Q0JVC1_9MAGN|nr:hypothetical protein NE237_028647 [Protea cynaroides]